MSGMSNLRFILHVSDFHLDDDSTEVEAVLSALIEELKVKKFKVDYLVHTGDIINSSDLYNKVARELKIDELFWGEEEDEETGKRRKTFLYEKYQEAVRENMENPQKGKKNRKPDINDLKMFNKRVENLVKRRFKLAHSVMRNFISDLNVAFGNVIICSGNHDVLRPLSAEKSNVICKKGADGRWEYSPSNAVGSLNAAFRGFLKNLGTANSTTRCKRNPSCTGEEGPECATCREATFCVLDDLNVLVLNTNWPNPAKQKSGYYCVNCVQVIDTLQQYRETAKDSDKLNVIVAHKPIYEVCEKARLPYKRYTTTPFFSEIQQFLGKEGIYLCGDKHTRSIVASLFHDIPHYIGGEPIRKKLDFTSEVEYNLLAVSNGQVDMKRKLHLSNSDGKWKCEVRPQDQTVKELYKISWKYISEGSFKFLGGTKPYPTWESLCQIVYNWTDEERQSWYSNIDHLYTPICRYRINGIPDNKDELESTAIFSFVQRRIIEQMRNHSAPNVLNIRGEHSAGKSMFLTQFYIHLMIEYSKGSFDFIPAYFNMENIDAKEIYRKMESGVPYCKAVKEDFETFVGKVQEMAKKEHQPVCYIIDGLDELDCWSYSTEDSVGRELLNILAKYDKVWYVMAFSQHNLPGFKNTMPLRKYNDASDIMYFNPVDVNDLMDEGRLEDGGITAGAYRESTGRSCTSLIAAYLQCSHCLPQKDMLAEDGKDDGSDDMALVSGVCETVKAFRRLTINPGFLHENIKYLIEINPATGKLRHNNESTSALYNYYIDRQYDLCLKELGYGFVKYAPAMAYLFAYKGYTYERFKDLHFESIQGNQHIFELIFDNRKNIYKAFLFIMKKKDAREYLIALHYNRELRYYAEHPAEGIEEDSILNEFITRNIAVLIRKMWTDTNKFVIACEHLLRRDDLSNCAQSMLIYCLSHLQMYEPIRNQLQDKMYKKARDTLKQQGLWAEGEDAENHPSGLDMIKEGLWKVTGANTAKKLECFRRLSLKHSMVVFSLMDQQDTQQWEGRLDGNEDFWIYNRQHQMLYYGDMSIKNDANIHALIPGSDLVYPGFDFHDCFHYIYVKLATDCSYPLRIYDLLTICDLLLSRLKCECMVEHLEQRSTFFYRDKDKDKSKAVLSQVRDVLKRYLDTENLYQPEAFKVICERFEKDIDVFYATVEGTKEEDIATEEKATGS